MMFYGIKFNNKHSFYDFGITMPPEKEIGFPTKEKIVVKVPFSNVEYDFSELYGSQSYGTRPLRYSFNVVDRNGNTKEKMNTMKTVLANWLMNTQGKQKLYDDAIPGYYFLAEVEGDMSFQENWDTGIITVTFKAYPFMIAELPEGNDLWDVFNFELDVAQNVEFTVNGSLTVTLLNMGTPDVVPEINTSESMTITKSGITYSIPAGVIQTSDFALKSGENALNITGFGTISFKFFKELI